MTLEKLEYPNWDRSSDLPRLVASYLEAALAEQLAQKTTFAKRDVRPAQTNDSNAGL